jgi:hypothetical protein
MKSLYTTKFALCKLYHGARNARCSALSQASGMNGSTALLIANEIILLYDSPAIPKRLLTTTRAP